ncbi:unannotated protein [freshwater metagenome]|jgi:microcystin-dependent protein|uniref:Unannotated protein n=1 Tax=freshwater metagenome TaxID=449393 RepID=A0A6J6H540_9ZZZZ|nr:tail fiber protein [Actinomycetota bacterium]
MDTFFGQILLFAFGYAPVNFLPCDGAELAVSQNDALFALIGNTFGGDGDTTFNLPNLVGPTPSNSGGVALQYCICVDGLWPVHP